nr:unnamed protein product [Digitaria exilis]
MQSNQRIFAEDLLLAAEVEDHHQNCLTRRREFAGAVLPALIFAYDTCLRIDRVIPAAADDALGLMGRPARASCSRTSSRSRRQAHAAAVPLAGACGQAKPLRSLPRSPINSPPPRSLPPPPIAARSAAAAAGSMQRINIDWREVFGSASSPGRGDDVCFESPSSAPPPPARVPRAPWAGARASSGGGNGRGTLRPRRTAEALRYEDDRLSPRGWGDAGARRPVTRAAAKITRTKKWKMRKEKLKDVSSIYSRKVQNVVLLDDEDMQTEGEVNCEMSDSRNELKIYYPSRDDPEAVELTSSDINCLDPGAYLSSPVINYYIQKIKRTTLHSEDCRNKFYIFNTYFYGKLEEALGRLGDFSKLRRWWKGVNIFHQAYIILPIHGTYLEEEWRHLKKNPSPDTSVSETTWEDLPSTIHKAKVQVPQQTNAYDCGIFMLYYIERFIREAPERLTIDKVDMFSCSWFKPEDASELRQRIRDLLLEEFASAGLDNAMSGAASDGSDIEDSIKGRELEADAPSDSSEMDVELGNTGKINEGIEVAALEEECGESGDAEKINEGIKVAESEEATGDSGDAGKSFEGINLAEPGEASGQPRDTGRSIEIISDAESDEASMEIGYAGTTRKCIKGAASAEASVECISADKSMGSVSDDAPTSSCKPKNEVVIPSTPIPDVVCDSCDSESDSKVGIVAYCRPDHHELDGFDAASISSTRVPSDVTRNDTATNL